jgi:hypothetical protein
VYAGVSGGGDRAERIEEFKNERKKKWKNGDKVGGGDEGGDAL